jgi:hypothetical protein
MATSTSQILVGHLMVGAVVSIPLACKVIRKEKSECPGALLGPAGMVLLLAALFWPLLVLILRSDKWGKI